ncbi:site-2 protease family protein [Novosphingobium sp.]|uniref:site-2 protease family protein n=1 Tax=Novosphingobium sp. TaxID=1874826 RepID=UPI0025FF2622|nr:site-2 protease family protein [Novosphingobium sp.]
MNDTLYQAATIIVPIVLAVVFHEVAHGYVASLLGDQTARSMGRLTLNPLRHVDPVGTVLLPGILALSHAPVFGWAKPVPVDAAQLRNPRRDMMLVALAGPGSNLVMALFSAVALGLLARFGASEQPGAVALFVAQNLGYFIIVNVSLGLFNLLPIPPFDGSHVVEGLLPRPAARVYASFRYKGLLVVFALIVVLPYLMPDMDLLHRVLGPPLEWVVGKLLMVTRIVAGVPLNQLFDA